MALIVKLMKMSIKKESVYRLNFIILCISVAPIHLIQMVFSWFIALHFEGFAGWNGWELIFLYGLLLTSYSIAQVFFRKFRFLEDFVVSGRMDTFFLRPQPLLFSLVFFNLNTMEIFSQLLPSVVILMISCFICGIQWNILKVIVLICAIIGGFIIHSSIFCLIGCVSFWTMKSNQLGEIYYSFKDFLNYPLHVYGKKVLAFLTYLFPLAFVNYYPALYILDKSEVFSVLEVMTLPAAIVLAMVTGFVWKISLGHYNSAGS